MKTTILAKALLAAFLGVQSAIPAEQLLLFEEGTSPLAAELNFHHGSWKFADDAMAGEQVPTEKHMATIKGLIPFDRVRLEWKMKFVVPKQRFLFVAWPADSTAHAMDFNFDPEGGRFRSSGQHGRM